MEASTFNQLSSRIDSTIRIRVQMMIFNLLSEKYKLNNKYKLKIKLSKILDTIIVCKTLTHLCDRVLVGIQFILIYNKFDPISYTLYKIILIIVIIVGPLLFKEGTNTKDKCPAW